MKEVQSASGWGLGLGRCWSGLCLPLPIHFMSTVLSCSVPACPGDQTGQDLAQGAASRGCLPLCPPGCPFDASCRKGLNKLICSILDDLIQQVVQ